MARSRSFRRWTLALWVACVLAATGGHPDRPGHTAAENAAPAAVGALSASADAAVLPARLADEVRSAAQSAPLRVIVLAAVLAALAGLPPLLRRPSPAAGRGRQPLRARRYAIALRAPPVQFA